MTAIGYFVLLELCPSPYSEFQTGKLRKFIANNSLGLYPRISANAREFQFIDARDI